MPTVIRVVAVFPEPTPYRTPPLDLIADCEDIELTVVYAARTVASRTWRVEAPASDGVPTGHPHSRASADSPGSLPSHVWNFVRD